MDLAVIVNIICFVVGGLGAWNIYLFKRTQDNEKKQAAFELYVARNYTSKEDLKELLGNMESRLEKQIGNMINTFNGVSNGKNN